MDIFSEKTILTVSRLTALLRGVLEENFEQLWVQGEVSNLSLPSSGHCYFTLKDSGAQLRCVMFKSAVKNLKFRPADGMALIVRGHISVYDQRGEYQLICEYLEPSGVGALQAAFVQLKEKLAGEGLFAEEHKLPLPRFPRKVGVVTSPAGAAIHDILNVLKRRFAALEVQICPVRVQGEGAALEIARAIEDMNRMAEVDVLIVGRGGGSLEDLWAFNEEVVARAVYRSRIPIISAVGHETDWSICDFAADLRAPTPSAAAELVIASADELRGQVQALSRQLVRLMESRLATLDASVGALRRALHDPRTMLGHLAQRVDDLNERLDLALCNSLKSCKEKYSRLENSLLHQNPVVRINGLRQRIGLLSAQAEGLMAHKLDLDRQKFGDNSARLDVLSPLKTLARGYAVAVRAEDGRVVTDAGDLDVGGELLLLLHRGRARCLVESLETAKT
ncbi:MAG: exodeoxyribonuclease VII large subunit [Geobacteraceae bacterium GWC2_55_20]|nr:MAG: exodeoxyribonuclease VII large subunit [Geobacteraceae bacterium GWC2_55_20]OGU22097.1 MAG: exodeoxyribonuclease VII large subunit [Geobacteraceae bacterium GWF2_54_21]HBA72344.1 exodeoxyribonuclease VII large subunit [Geobacter sp.]HCE67415.1 exodeoxyribonuclease VII large subunit [Geobacter sp.]